MSPWNFHGIFILSGINSCLNQPALKLELPPRFPVWNYNNTKNNNKRRYAEQWGKLYSLHGGSYNQRKLNFNVIRVQSLTTNHCLGRNVHVESKLCQAMPTQTGSAWQQCKSVIDGENLIIICLFVSFPRQKQNKNKAKTPADENNVPEHPCFQCPTSLT